MEKIISELCEVGSHAVKSSLVLASGGNLSARLDDNKFVITAAGTWLDKLTPADFVVMTLTGEVLSGQLPSSEWKLHQRAYLARPDAGCVIHLHPQNATLLATLGYELRMFTLDHAAYVASVGVTDFYPNGSDELADTAAAALATHNCVIMRHHGCSVVAENVSMAYRRVLNLESAAEYTLKALQLGDTTTRFTAASWHA